MVASPEEGELVSPPLSPAVPLQPQPPPPAAAEEQPTTTLQPETAAPPANGHEPASVGLSIKGGAVQHPPPSIEQPITKSATADDKTQLPFSASPSAPAPVVTPAAAAAPAKTAVPTKRPPISILSKAVTALKSNPLKASPKTSSRSSDKSKLQQRSAASSSSSNKHSYSAVNPYDPAPDSLLPPHSLDVSPSSSHKPLTARIAPAVDEDASFKPLPVYGSPPKAPRTRAPAREEPLADPQDLEALAALLGQQAPVHAPSGSAGGDPTEASRKLEERRKEKEQRDREMEEREKEAEAVVMRDVGGPRPWDIGRLPPKPPFDGFGGGGGRRSPPPPPPRDFAGGQAPQYRRPDSPDFLPYDDQYAYRPDDRGPRYAGGGQGSGGWGSMGGRRDDYRRGGGGYGDRSRDSHDDRQDRRGNYEDRRDYRRSDDFRRDSHRRSSHGQHGQSRLARHDRPRSRSPSRSPKRSRTSGSFEGGEARATEGKRDPSRSPMSRSSSGNRSKERKSGEESKAAQAAALVVENQEEEEEEEESGTPPPKPQEAGTPLSRQSKSSSHLLGDESATALPSDALRATDPRPPLAFSFKSFGLPPIPLDRPSYGGAKRGPPPAAFASQPPPPPAPSISNPPPPPLNMEYPSVSTATNGHDQTFPPPIHFPNVPPPPLSAPPPPPPLDDDAPHRDETPHAPPHPALESQVPTPSGGRSPRSFGDEKDKEEQKEEVPNPRRRVRLFDEKKRDLLDPWISEKERDSVQAFSRDQDAMEVDMDMELAVSPTPAPEERTEERTFVGSSHITEYTLQEKLGEGTFGVVWKGVKGQISGVGEAEVRRIEQSEEKLVGQGLKVRRGDVVALKQIILHNEGDGMPITSLREIRILKSLNHPNIVPVVDIAYEPGNAETFAPGKTYMVFPYMDHDLAGLLENHQVRLLPSHIKQYAMQLLEGTRYLHLNGILHRDMKAANLLISNAGVLMIADFGLARSIEAYEKGRQYTNCVVTRWYRPPELLIGETRYHFPVDMWGVGCVIAEMFKKTPIFPGDSDTNQAHKIFQHCGSPNSSVWYGWRKIAGLGPEEPHQYGDFARTIRADALAWSDHDAGFADLLDKILVLDPRKRLTASEALDHEWFWTDPMPTEPSRMPSYMASHEYDKRKREEERPRIPPMPQPQPRPPIVPPFQHGGYNHQPPPYGPPPGFGAPPPQMAYGSIPPPSHMNYQHQQQQRAYGQPVRGGGYGGGARGGHGAGGGGGRGGRQPDYRYELQRPSWNRNGQNTGHGAGGDSRKVNLGAMLAGAPTPGAPSRDQPPNDPGPTNLKY